MAPPNYSSIGIDRTQLAELQAVKQRWEDRARRRFRWGDFLMMLLAVNERNEPRMSQESLVVAEMHQDDEPLSGEQLAGAGLVRDDAMTLEVATMTGGRAHLSEETIEAIAEKVAAKLLEIMKPSDGTEQA